MGELVFVGEALLLPVVVYLGGIYAYAVLGSVWLYLRLSGIESKAGTLYQGRGISSISLVAGILHAISMETMHRHPLSVFLTRIYACYFLSDVVHIATFGKLSAGWVESALTTLSLLCLVFDRYTYGLLWGAPPDFMIFSVLFGFLGAQLLRKWAKSVEVDRQWLTYGFLVIAVYALSYFWIPLLLTAGSNINSVDDNHEDIPHPQYRSRGGEGLLKAAGGQQTSPDTLTIPEPFCEQILQKQLSEQAFRYIVYVVTGWNVLPENAKVFYEIVAASGSCDLSNQITKNIAGLLKSDFILSSLGFDVLPSMLLPTLLERLQQVNRNATELGALVTGLVGLLSMLRLNLIGPSKSKKND